MFWNFSCCWNHAKSLSIYTPLATCHNKKVFELFGLRSPINGSTISSADFKLQFPSIHSLCNYIVLISQFYQTQRQYVDLSSHIMTHEMNVWVTLQAVVSRWTMLTPSVSTRLSVNWCRSLWPDSCSMTSSPTQMMLNMLLFNSSGNSTITYEYFIHFYLIYNCKVCRVNSTLNYHGYSWGSSTNVSSEFIKRLRGECCSTSWIINGNWFKNTTITLSIIKR